MPYLTTGSIFLLRAGKGAWHAPSGQAGGQQPLEGQHHTACGRVIPVADLQAIRLPFPAGNIPRHICKRCRF